MGRSKKNSNSDSVDFVSQANQHNMKARKNAITLLEKCLGSNGVVFEEIELILDDVSVAFDVSEKITTNEDKMADQNMSNSEESVLTTSKSHKKTSDEHNESCDVCDTGGDLLCCDTCSLVFHLKCIRPKMTNIPKGDWSCPQCILDGLFPGQLDVAKKALRAMNRVSCGVASDDEMDGRRLSKHKTTHPHTVVQSGKKFAVRQLDSKQQNVELGRFSTLDEALWYISEVNAPPTKKAPKSGKAARRHSAYSSDEEEEEEEDDELWCTRCMDDDRITTCVFCGCKKCYGKYDSDLLILCDHCDREIHTYCFDPPYAQVPDDDPWFCCQQCVTESMEAQEEEEKEEEITSEQQEEEEDSRDAEAVTSSGRRRRRRSNSGNITGLHVDAVAPTSLDATSSDDELGGDRGWDDDDDDADSYREGDEYSQAGSRGSSAKDSKKRTRRQSSISSTASIKSSKSALSTSVNTAVTPTPSRGRGRPPGSKRKLDPAVSVTTGSKVAVPPQQSQGKSQSASLLTSANISASSQTRNQLLSVELLGDQQAYKTSRADELPVVVPAVRESRVQIVESTTAGLDMVRRIVAKSSKRLFRSREEDSLEQFRRWAPRQDAEAVLEMLLAQRDKLFDRIRVVEPSYNPFAEWVPAQFASSSSSMQQEQQSQQLHHQQETLPHPSFDTNYAPLPVDFQAPSLLYILPSPVSDPFLTSAPSLEPWMAPYPSAPPSGLEIAPAAEDVGLPQSDASQSRDEPLVATTESPALMDPAIAAASLDGAQVVVDEPRISADEPEDVEEEPIASAESEEVSDDMLPEVLNESDPEVVTEMTTTDVFETDSVNVDTQEVAVSAPIPATVEKVKRKYNKTVPDPTVALTDSAANVRKSSRENKGVNVLLAFDEIGSPPPVSRKTKRTDDSADSDQQPPSTAKKPRKAREVKAADPSVPPKKRKSSSSSSEKTTTQSDAQSSSLMLDDDDEGFLNTGVSYQQPLLPSLSSLSTDGTSPNASLEEKIRLSMLPTSTGVYQGGPFQSQSPDVLRTTTGQVDSSAQQQGGSLWKPLW